MNFLFLIYFVGLFIAVYQDFTRREIDDWLNLFLFFSGVLFLIVNANLLVSSNLIFFGFFIFIICLLSFGFYYARFFSGGDSKLFFAISPLLFVSFSELSFFYLLFFIFSLFFCGSIYSLVYSFILFFKDFKKTKVYFVKEVKKKVNLYTLLVGFLFFIFGFFESILFSVAIFVFLFSFLICFAKTLEEISMKREVSTKNLREGDWLFNDVKVGNKMFKKSWEGLSSKDILYMESYDKKVLIKDGIPYAPAFLFAVILFYFKDFFMGFLSLFIFR